MVTVENTIRDMEVGTAVQWAAEGVSAKRLRTMVRDGQLIRKRHGIYATAAAVVAAHQDKAHAHALEVRAALRAASAAGAVASHESAALIHGIPLLREPSEGLVSLTRPATVFRDRPLLGVRFYPARLPAGHVTMELDVPVTTIARTVIDLSRTRSFMDGVVAADHAMRTLRISKSALSRVIDACKGWPGTDHARRVVHFSDERSGSPLESSARVVFDAFRLPAPELRAEVTGGPWVNSDGTVAHEYHECKVDFMWQEYMTVAEIDGLMKHDSGQRAIDERKRDRLIREAGYKLVHITWAELLKYPEQIIQRVLDAFAATYEAWYRTCST
jgi:hypothetical protein